MHKRENVETAKNERQDKSDAECGLGLLITTCQGIVDEAITHLWWELQTKSRKS